MSNCGGDGVTETPQDRARDVAIRATSNRS